MIQGATLDVAIGVLLLFLVVSLLGSAIVEAVGGFFHRRSKNLWDTIDLMLGQASIEETGEKLVDRIYRQPFVTTLVQPKAQRLYPKKLEEGTRTRDVRSFKSGLDPDVRKRRFHGPQHLGSKAFASSFIEAIKPDGIVDDSVAELKSAVADFPDAISKPIGALLAEIGDDFVAARERIERWYDDHMTAVSVWYRRQTRYFLFVAGLVIAVVGNIDPVAATKTLYRDDAVRESVLQQAELIGASECEPSEQVGERIECLRDELGGSVAFPVGWSGIDHSAASWTLRVVGWLLAAGAVTIGAPFWFDLLRRALAHRRGGSSDQ